MESLAQDVRHSLRSLSSSPTFVLLAVFCLALGVGLSTMVFTVVNGLLLQPLPFPEADRLVLLNEVRHDAPAEAHPVSHPTFRDWRQHGGAVAEIAAMRTRRVTITVQNDPERLAGAFVTWNLLPTLGIQPVLGRPLREDEDRPAAGPVALLSETLWEQRYGRDPGVLGSSVAVDGVPHTVVGVMPRLAHPMVPGFLRGPRLWIPLTPAEHASGRDDRSLVVIARLAHGLDSGDAASRLVAVAAALEQDHPEHKGWGIALRPVAGTVSENTRSLLLTTLGAAVFVLLIACANVAHLMLARATRRRREMAVRIAVGASRGRIVRQLLTESTILGLASVPFGVLLAWWGVGVVLHSGPQQATSVALPIDGRVVAFTIGLALLTSAVFGLAPALHALRAAREALIDSGRDATITLRQKLLQNALVVSELALSLVLLVGAALFVRSFMNMLHVETGLDPRALMTLKVEMAGERYASADAVVHRLEEILARLESVPGIEAAAASNLTPLRGGGARTTAILEQGDSTVGVDDRVVGASVTSRFLEAWGVPLVHGRSFTGVEARTRSAVAVVNKRMADRLWPDQGALGRRFRLQADPDGIWYTVIGVSGDIANWDLSDRPVPTAYLPYAHDAVNDPRVVIRTAGDPSHVVGPARAAIHAVDATLPISEVQSMSEIHRAAFWRQQTFGTLLAIFGGLGVLLAAIGLYGVLSFLVSQRRREIGIRMALGAGRREVVGWVVRQGAVLMLPGLCIGLAGAFAASRLLRGFLYHVTATDPFSFAAVALALSAVGLLASYVPARRAAEMDPVTAMRE
ncbi:MAG TPA: ABC transporter permease [Vicinamibacterales bacterium]|nr:ABC transporter permease [Vicinamibacterales bacterium]